MVRRLNEGFKAGAKENRMLSKIYSVYNAIEHSNDLRKHGLSLSDYRAFPDVFQQLQNIGYAETFVKSLADFFKKNGFGVALDDDGVNYVITFDGGVRESKKRPLKKTVKESLEPDAGYIEIYNVNKNKIAKEVEEAANEALAYVGSDEARPTWHWNIGEDEDNYYAIVLGFNSEDEVAMKWAYISKDSIMNEYDMDYLMPYDSDTGDVWDSEQIVDGGYDMTADVEYLLNNFKEYADQRNSEWDEFADDLYGVDDDDFDEDDLEYESIRLKRESTNKRRPTSKRKRNK